MTILSRSEVFILHSYTEIFPNVILEAMALGKAIIATDVGAVSEMLMEESGIIIPPKDINEVKKHLMNC